MASPNLPANLPDFFRSRLSGAMICPACKAEYRQGFTRCADCDVDLVQNYNEAASQLLAKKVVVSEKYGSLLWEGTDPHFYVDLLWSLWEKKVACYGKPERPPITEHGAGLQSGNVEPGGFEVWVSEENLPLAKWILESASKDFEAAPPEERAARETVLELSTEAAGVCPLCFAEFTTAGSYCPNCGVPLRSAQPDVGTGDSVRRLCNFAHPKFIRELRGALQMAEIPFNNANVYSGDIISGRYYIPNYEVLVLGDDFERARNVMRQVLQNWEFEPSAGFWIGRDPLFDYWPVRATENGWLHDDMSALVWVGPSLVSLGNIEMGLRENEIPYRIVTEQLGTAEVFSHPDDASRARRIVREIVEGALLE